MGLDKFKAKKGYWRTPEKTIFTITLLGGGVGTVAGMYVFRHKTKNPKFYLGFSEPTPHGKPFAKQMAFCFLFRGLHALTNVGIGDIPNKKARGQRM